MRVAEFYKPESGVTNGCGTMDSGEGEDYTIVVDGNVNIKQSASDGADRMEIFPSSSSREFLLVLPEGINRVDMTAFDMSGKKVFALSKNGGNRVRMNFENLKNGIYNLKIQMGDKWMAKTILLK